MGCFDPGDIITFVPDTSHGHEPKGRRPALVVSSFEFNISTSMTIVCPITSTKNDFPLHIELPDGLDTYGRVVCEQVRAYDLNARDARRIERVPDVFMDKITECVRSFF